MLRLLVLLLVLANAGYFVWAQGFLREWGLAPSSPSEPQRLQQQIKPDAVRILPASEAQSGAAPTLASATSAECLLAAPIDDVQLARVKEALAPWPPGSWSLEPVAPPASWLIYMGRYADVEQLARKKAELRQRGVEFDPVADPALEPGLSLGRFASESEANTKLQALARSGVRSARVLQVHAEKGSHQLKLPAVDDSVRARLDSLRPVLAAIQLRPCRLPGDKNP